MSITGPCRVCGVVVRSETGLDGLLCGPACRALYDERQAAREVTRPGDHNYHPENDVQRLLHRKALSRKSYGSAML